MSENSSQHDLPRHPIQVVARRTGLSADVIRVWERRYGAVNPERAPAGRRLYSDDDIERLALLRQVTQAGRRIGDVAGLPHAELAALAAEDRAAQAAEVGALPANAEASAHLQEALDAVRNMDSLRLQAALSQAAAAFSQPVLVEQVVVPLLRAIGQSWQDGTIRVCHEHLASAVLRAFLDAQRATANMDGSGPTLLIATPTGQGHELGALLVALTAATDGWNTVYLGANTPAADIAAAAARTRARAVSLTISYPGDDPRLADELRTLARQLPNTTTLLAGGRAASAYSGVLEEIGARRGESLADLRALLDSLRAAAA
ncbi:MAG: MerR family transcriptional regulator [Gammaproteobacteria bacterium]